ncbi:MAG: polysaccharide biosynthesis/export family protein, partial [Planctomycetota bacterium]
LCSASLAATVVLVGTTGCTSTQALPREQAPIVREIGSVLRPGDEVEIRVFSYPELNDTQRIRADGKISLTLLGDVQAAGYEPGQLAEVISGSLENSNFLRIEDAPQVTVILREAFARRVFVGGEVRQPGVIPTPGPITAFDAITLAGGMDLRSAAPRHVFVLRTTAEGRAGYTVDMSEVLSGDMTKPFYLQPGDHVYVPRTAITNANQFMQQYIAGMVPKAGVFFSRTTGTGTYGVDTSTGTFGN